MLGNMELPGRSHVKQAKPLSYAAQTHLFGGPAAGDLRHVRRKLSP
jgi:hypothetical protein